MIESDYSKTSYDSTQKEKKDPLENRKLRRFSFFDNHKTPF